MQRLYTTWIILRTEQRNTCIDPIVVGIARHKQEARARPRYTIACMQKPRQKLRSLLLHDTAIASAAAYDRCMNNRLDEPWCGRVRV